MKISKGPPLTHRAKALNFSDRDSAAALALRALAFIAADVERLERFFALTGVAPGDVRDLAMSPGFQLAVLDHLAAEEALLVEFAGLESASPEAVMGARRALGGGES
jgi:hypothetical protein